MISDRVLVGLHEGCFETLYGNSEVSKDWPDKQRHCIQEALDWARTELQTRADAEGIVVAELIARHFIYGN